MKGLTSIELAILLAIIIVIAVAVGWYMYTTFIASTAGQAKLMVTQATFSSSNQQLTLTVVNPGPVQQVVISSIYLGGQSCSSIKVGTSGAATITSTGTFNVTATCSVTATPGTTLQGYVVLSSGTSFPFTATVNP